jgi:hypothetical protein
MISDFSRFFYFSMAFKRAAPFRMFNFEFILNAEDEMFDERGMRSFRRLKKQLTAKNKKSLCLVVNWL